MDSSLFESINRFAERTTWAHGFMRWYADNGIVLFALMLLAGFLMARRTADHTGEAGSVAAGAAALVALAIGQLIGNIVDRARPYETLSNVQVLVDRTTDFSFPSDHATAVGAVAVGLWFVNRRLGTVAVVAAVFMAFTRVYVGAHYPGDVVAGFALGGAVAYGCHRLLTPLLTNAARSLAGTPLRWLVGTPEVIEASPER